MGVVTVVAVVLICREVIGCHAALLSRVRRLYRWDPGWGERGVEDWQCTLETHGRQRRRIALYGAVALLYDLSGTVEPCSRYI